MTPASWVKQRYDPAQTLGSELAVVAVGSLAQSESASFAVLWNSLHALTTAEAKRDHLRSLADQGHLGANLWLGRWYSGRRFGLGLLPTADRGPEARGQALQSLDRARKMNFLNAGTWYAETLLSGDPTPAERAEAREVLEHPGSMAGVVLWTGGRARADSKRRKGECQNAHAKSRSREGICHRSL